MMILEIGTAKKKSNSLSNKKKGFTLLEIVITMAIIAMVIVIAIPSINSLTRLNLNSDISKIQSLIKETYINAALSGGTQRIVFDISNNSFWVESTTSVFKLEKEELDVDYDGKLKLEEEEFKDNNNSNSRPKFLPVNNKYGNKQKLSNNINFFGIWVDYINNIVKNGVVYLYFFPSGYTQEAKIGLYYSEENKTVKTIIVEPLTGYTIIENNEPKLER